MTTQHAPASVHVDPVPATNPSAKATPPSLAWLKGALLLAGAAQLITISALTSADPLTVTWASLLLAIPPAPVNRVAPVVAVLVLVGGIVGAIVHTGLFFVPALVVLAIGGVKLGREPSRARQ